jgi:hypothetical protein
MQNESSTPSVETLQKPWNKYIKPGKVLWHWQPGYGSLECSWTRDQA